MLKASVCFGQRQHATSQGSTFDEKFCIENNSYAQVNVRLETRVPPLK